MRGLGLERLIEEKSEQTTVDRILKSLLSREKKFENIHGIRDVKEELMNALERAAFISRQGYTPIILLRGPSGSGKTEIIDYIVRTYKEYSKTNDIFTLKINDITCPYKENPYNLYRSILPISLSNDFRDKITNRKRPQLCSVCEDNINKSKDEDSIVLEKVFPQSSTIELDNNLLSYRFMNIVKNSNRSILTISADRSKIENIDSEVFQLINNMYDNNLSDDKGNRIPLDMLVIIHSNESFTDYDEDIGNELTPLLDRIILVNVRRNLSYSEEEKITKDFNLPISKMIPNALRYISKFNVLSRIHFDKQVDSTDFDKLDNILELLDYYDSYRLKELEMKMTQSMSNFIGKLLPNYSQYISDTGQIESKYLIDAARKLIFSDRSDEMDKGIIDEYKSGWTDGVSPRAISDIINFNYTRNRRKDYILFSDIARYINYNIDKLSDESAAGISNYIDHIIVNDIKFDIDYAILSYYYGDHFKEYTDAIMDYFNFLLSGKPENEYKDTRGLLNEASRYLYTEWLKNEINPFKFKKMPLEMVNFKPTFDDLFSYMISTNKDFIKRENQFKSFIGENGQDFDKTTNLYGYIHDFLINKRGYFEEAVDEAIRIYKEGTIFYDE